MASTSEIKLGQLVARVEWETVLDAATATLRPTKVQLVLIPDQSQSQSSNGYTDLTVLGVIEPLAAGS